MKYQKNFHEIQEQDKDSYCKNALEALGSSTRQQKQKNYNY